MQSPNRSTPQSARRSGFVFILLASCTLGACVTGPVGAQDFSTAGQNILCQPGMVEVASAVIVTPAGTSLAGGFAREPTRVRRDPSEADMIQGMTLAASQAAAAQSLSTDSSGRAGTAYMVGLRCGGVVYVFEPGPQEFAPGAEVIIEQGLIPRLRAK